jgi:hypothetical protein
MAISTLPTTESQSSGTSEEVRRTLGSELTVRRERAPSAFTKSSSVKRFYWSEPTDPELGAAEAYWTVLESMDANHEGYAEAMDEYEQQVALCDFDHAAQYEFQRRVANVRDRAEETESSKDDVATAHEATLAVEKKPLPAAPSTPVERTTRRRSEKTYKYDHRPLLKYVLRVIDDEAGIELLKTERDVLSLHVTHWGEEIFASKELQAQALKKVTGRGSVSTIWYALHGRDGKPGLVGKGILTAEPQNGRTARGTTPPTIYRLNPSLFPAEDRPKP